MNSLVLLVAMSLMLVGAIVVVAIPNQAEAAPKWCNSSGDCFGNEKKCQQAWGADCSRLEPYK